MNRKLKPWQIEVKARLMATVPDAERVRFLPSGEVQILKNGLWHYVGKRI